MLGRPVEHVDTLRVLFWAAREFANEGSRLPTKAAVLLYFLGIQPDGVAEFADVRLNCGFGQSQASRLSAALASAGLISIKTPAEDRRKTRLELTMKGRSVIDRIVVSASHS